MKFYLPGNAGSVDLGIDVDIGQSSEADRAFVAGLLRAAAGWLDPAPVVETPPIISPTEEQLPKALSLLAGEIADLRDSERALRTELARNLNAQINSEVIPSSETPDEEPHERHDEPLRVSLYEVPSSLRDSGRGRLPDGRENDNEPLLQRASDGGSGVQQEPVAEADVRATPTMTPEESMIWEAEQAAIPVVLKQAKPSRSAGWNT